MPPPPSVGGKPAGPSTFDKLKMGALMGGAVGACVGVFFGGFSVLRYGGGQAGILRTWGKIILSSAATFGFFMSIGTVIRTEGIHDVPMLPFHQGSMKPVIITGRSMDRWRDYSRFVGNQKV